MTRADTVLLAPSRPVAGLWSAIGLAACGLAAWVVGDSDGHGLAWALLVACVTLTVPYLAQLVAPGRFTWHVGDEALVVRSPVRELVVPWASVHLARVVRQAGEPALELQLDLPEGRQTRLALLPVGADRAVLHRELAARLGVPHTSADDPAANVQGRPTDTGQ
jgi:hypothetical protein